MKRPQIVASLLCLCIFVLQLYYLQLRTDTDLLDGQYEKLQEKLQDAKKTNVELQDNLYELESFTTIASSAASMGFILQNTESIFLDSQ